MIKLLNKVQLEFKVCSEREARQRKLKRTAQVRRQDLCIQVRVKLAQLNAKKTHRSLNCVGICI